MIVLPFPFQLGVHLFFSCPIAVASGESGHPCLFPDVRGKCFQLFILEYDVSWGLVIYGPYYVEIFSLYTYFVERFYHGC